MWGYSFSVSVIKIPGERDIVRESGAKRAAVSNSTGEGRPCISPEYAKWGNEKVKKKIAEKQKQHIALLYSWSISMRMQKYLTNYSHDSLSFSLLLPCQLTPQLPTCLSLLSSHLPSSRITINYYRLLFDIGKRAKGNQSSSVLLL